MGPAWPGGAARACCLGFLALAAAGLRGVPSHATLRQREGVNGVRASIVDHARTGVAAGQHWARAWLAGRCVSSGRWGALAEVHKRQGKAGTAGFCSAKPQENPMPPFRFCDEQLHRLPPCSPSQDCQPPLLRSSLFTLPRSRSRRAEPHQGVCRSSPQPPRSVGDSSWDPKNVRRGCSIPRLGQRHSD